MSKLRKQDVVFRMMQEGLTTDEANTALDVVTKVVRESLLNGDEIPFVGIGKLVGEIKPPEERKMFGSTQYINERLSVKFRPSRALYEEFKRLNSKEFKVSKGIDLLRSKLK